MVIVVLILLLGILAIMRAAVKLALFAGVVVLLAIAYEVVYKNYHYYHYFHYFH